MSTVKEQLETIAGIKKARDEGLKAYHAAANTASQPALRDLSKVVENAQEALSAAITEGADPCPKCKTAPTGMEQPHSSGGFEYEVGCTKCGQFTHTDGTIRATRVRGGTIPKHAVEAWNAGPDAWQIVPERKVKK